MSKLLEKLRTDVEKLEAQVQSLRAQVVQALKEGDEKRASRLEQDLERAERRLTLVGEALQGAQAEADRERAAAEAAERERRERLARSFDARNREVAETFAGLLLLCLEAFSHWQALRSLAVAESGRLPSPLDLRPRAEWQRGLEAILRALAPLLGDLSPAIPQDVLKGHWWRAQTLEDLAKSLQPPLSDLAVAAARRERRAVAHLPEVPRKELAAALATRDRSGVSPLPLTGPEVPRRRTEGS